MFGNHLESVPEIGNLTMLQSLFLSENNIRGNIPSSIFNISSLQVIDLNKNQLSGSIPLMFGKSSSLQMISLNNNKLSGFLPFTAFNISSQLQVIDFSTNNITGPIPSNMFDNFPNLQWLSLSWNQLSGRIPIGLFKCQQLAVLSLSANHLEGPLPVQIGNLTSLRTLMLGLNNLEGGIPVEIGNLVRLEELFLGLNSLSGSVPHTIFNSSAMTTISLPKNVLSGGLPSGTALWLPNVQFFEVGDNKFSGSIPSSISNASRLIRLDLGNNLFSGSVPNTLGNLRHLQVLNLEHNNLTSPGLSFITSLVNCKNLTYLVFNDNPMINSELPSSIGNLSIQFLSAYGSNILGGIPLEIGNLSNLISLNLQSNRVAGMIPSTIGKLSKLQAIYLGYNELQSYIPSELCRLDRLSILFLAGNKLSGPIPACLGHLISLRQLALGSNRFNASIPSTLTRLADILLLDLSSNFLSGFLPIDIGKLRVVTDMRLSGNQLSGHIPTGFGDLKDLTYLTLSSNNLQGSIPQSFGDMIGLEHLDLSRNDLSGTIPMSLEKLLNLKYFNVSFNRLQGEIPGGGTFSNYSIQSFMGNEGLCGAPWLQQVPPCKTNSYKRSNKTAKLLEYILPAVFSTTVLILIVIIIFLRSRKRKASLPSRGNILPLATWRRLSYQELQQATDGFCENNLLGVGSFGSVYKGTLLDGMSIAVKVFNMELEGAFKSFDVECDVLRNIRHKNLVKIITSCSNFDFKALVLEFMPNGSLEKWLYSHNHFLDILQRLNIMIDVASALEYLHHGLATPVVHCDLKPSNILLDEAVSAHLSDFGIAKLLGEEDSLIQTITLATIGYMAPEYGADGIVSIRGDVYSFGILLMETFTGKKPTNEMFSGEMSLKYWVKQYLPSASLQLIDANMLRQNGRERERSVAKDCAMSVLHLAQQCSVELPEERIGMKEVVAKLKKIKINFLKGIEHAR
ncbi:hypothetical protein DITRI_Ditri09bG0080600 [Diplodiscus trichospermus]